MNKIGYDERKKVYQELLARHGQEKQVMKAIEELGELTVELSKLIAGEGRKGSVAEEIADVTIMLEQLRIMFEMNESVSLYMDMKIRRAAENLAWAVQPFEVGASHDCEPAVQTFGVGASRDCEPGRKDYGEV